MVSGLRTVPMYPRECQHAVVIVVHVAAGGTDLEDLLSAIERQPAVLSAVDITTLDCGDRPWTTDVALTIPAINTDLRLAVETARRTNGKP